MTDQQEQLEAEIEQIRANIEKMRVNTNLATKKLMWYECILWAGFGAGPIIIGFTLGVFLHGASS